MLTVLNVINIYLYCFLTCVFLYVSKAHHSRYHTFIQQHRVKMYQYMYMHLLIYLVFSSALRFAVFNCYVLNHKRSQRYEPSQLLSWKKINWKKNEKWALLILSRSSLWNQTLAHFLIVFELFIEMHAP